MRRLAVVRDAFTGHSGHLIHHAVPTVAISQSNPMVSVCRESVYWDEAAVGPDRIVEGWRGRDRL
jgi:hypothetical protein